MLALKRGASLYSPGDKSDAVYFLLEGSVMLSRQIISSAAAAEDSNSQGQQQVSYLKAALSLQHSL